MDDRIFDVLLGILGLVLLNECVKALRSGTARGRRGQYPRETSPVAYWIHVVAQGVGGLVLAIVGFLKGLSMLQ